MPTRIYKLNSNNFPFPNSHSHLMEQEEGKSPDRDSPESGARKSTISSGGRVHDTKEFLRKFVDSDSLKENLTDWNGDVDGHDTVPSFDVPFELIDLQKFDYALEGIPFHQLIRMPNSIYASTSSNIEATAYLALEDFLHASVNGLWQAFWGIETDADTMPFYISSLYEGSLRFYEAEKAIAKGKLERLCATAIMVKNPRHPQGKWDDIVELVLLREGIGSVENNSKPPLSIMSEALFFALRVLLARSISRSNIPVSLNSVFILLVDSQYGGVIKVEGDLNKLEMDLNNVYESAAAWIKNHSRITISRFDRIWNKLGNANWEDIGALQVLYASYLSIAQYAGTPKNSVEDLAADHSSRLQARRIERQLGDKRVDENGLFRLQHQNASPEIVEVQEESIKVDNGKIPVKLEVGTVILVEDSNQRNGYQIKEIVNDGEILYYVAFLVEDPGRALFLYIGSHPAKLEPTWEDMKYWYQVQRQTKVLSVMKQKGLSTKNLPEINASGRVVHPGPCRKPISGGNCDYPWCGTHVLLMSPVGTTVADMVRAGQFGVDEAIQCCHDCLSALSASSSGGVMHGDIRPENIVHVKSGVGRDYFVVNGWGHAILEERDRPVLNLHYSSTSALQEGKLYSASDAESLVYVLYFCSGGDLPVLDSVEGALQWRETAWSRRVIQQTLGEINAVFKAFADYVDSLCGTPYSVNYDIWLRRLRKQFNEEENEKEVHTSS